MNALAGVRRTSGTLRVCILALAGAGAWASGELLKQHDNIWNAAGRSSGFGGSICTVGRELGFDCAEASQDGWSEIPVRLPVLSGGYAITIRPFSVPVAFIGLAYFVFMLAWFAQAGSHPFGPRWNRVPVLLGRCAAAVSIICVGLMVFGAFRSCLGCFMTHAISLMMVLAIERLCRDQVRDNAARLDEIVSPGRIPAPNLTHADATRFIATALAAISGLWMYRSQHLAFRDELAQIRPYKQLVSRLRDDSDFLFREYNAQSRHAIPSRSPDASRPVPHELIIFTDYQCPGCSCATREAQELLAGAISKGLRVTIRHYPLCRDCNGYAKRTVHVAACEAAYAAEAARRLGGAAAFDRMHRLLVENHQRLSQPLFIELAARIGLDLAKFIREFEGGHVRRIVADDIALASRLGVKSTPAMFLDGRRVPELCRTPAFWNAVAQRWNGVTEGAMGVAAASTATDDSQGD